MKQNLYSLIKIKNKSLNFLLSIFVFFAIQCGNNDKIETEAEDDDLLKLKSQSQFSVINLKQDASRSDNITSKVSENIKNPSQSCNSRVSMKSSEKIPDQDTSRFEHQNVIIF